MESLTLERLLSRNAPKVLGRLPRFARPWVLSLGERLLHLPEVREFFAEHSEARGAELDVRYLFGCVSNSGAYPEPAKELLVHFFRTWFGEEGGGARARNPFTLSNSREKDLRALLPGEHYREVLRRLKEALKLYGCAIPTLFKQYAELCEPGGTRFLAFGVDPDFGHCVDGFILVDVTQITAEKRARYIERVHHRQEVAS